MRFDQLGLAEPILRAVKGDGYDVPTPIQAQSIPHILAGKDMFGSAQTGTGKTAAFALPILQRLMTHATADLPSPAHPRATAPAHAEMKSHGQPPVPVHARRMPHAGPARRIRALVLAPTRELAAQIGQSFSSYGRFTGLRNTVIFGGVGQSPQARALREGIDVVVATPGRLLDLMNQGLVDLRAIEVFVLDEADRMFDMGFIHDIRRVVAKLPPAGTRQTLLFSATMPGEIRELASAILRNPVSVAVAPISATADRIDQSVYFVEAKNKPALLVHLLNSRSFTRALVFTRTKHGADKVARKLETAGIGAEAIHGNKSQNARNRAMGNFRSGKTAVLVASDIAARGIDIDEISHVVNFDMPNEAETYVHRIGRTARAGASGEAVSFCDSAERSYLKAIERLTKKSLTVMNDHPIYPPTSPDEHRGGRSGGHGGGGGRGQNKPRFAARTSGGHAPAHGSSHPRPSHAAQAPAPAAPKAAGAAKSGGAGAGAVSGGAPHTRPVPQPFRSRQTHAAGGGSGGGSNSTGGSSGGSGGGGSSGGHPQSGKPRIRRRW
ncbi:MAG: DEAD/DEAH box helicase [Planctomycetota bacterium]|nr:DEAD/DEAH box helicase [Planctomycetota bacterium]